VCISVNENQHHVINHLTGKEMNETRNIIVEAGRIARGAVLDINSQESLDVMLVIPGGFGSAKNLTNWAFEGPNII
jgi:enhancing lycopene biosynthesis protein 2